MGDLELVSDEDPCSTPEGDNVPSYIVGGSRNLCQSSGVGYAIEVVEARTDPVERMGVEVAPEISRFVDVRHGGICGSPIGELELLIVLISKAVELLERDAVLHLIRHVGFNV